jgi:iron complex outermembrane receptor protein
VSDPPKAFFMHRLVCSGAAAGAFLLVPPATWAQAQAPAAGTLAPVTVTGNPLGATEVAAPVSTLSGTGLLLRRQGSLGETLSGLPGVASTYFGPASSRPVIRGLDGDRIRILENSGAMRDVSSLSYDHAVSADPIAVERIEVLRGPGALLYGGNAMGGVVNLIDNRIPREPIGGVLGRVEGSAASGARERNLAALVEAGNDRIGLHVDAFERRFGDTRVPADLPCTQGGVTTTARRLCNSDGQARGGAVGGSLFFDRGYVGASVSEMRSSYGSVAEDEVRIRMASTRYALQGEVRDPLPGLLAIKAHAARSRYEHTEFDAGVPGTVFRNRGNDARVEARHVPIGPLQGVIGLQTEQGRFSAEGTEAFAPPSRTDQRAVFIYEELPLNWGKLSFGARRESVGVESLGNPALPRFPTGRRDFAPSSWSLGALWNVAPAWQATGSIGRTQRAPKDYELFANGPHVATGAYEVGDPSLGVERARSMEAGLQWKSGANRVKGTVWQTRFSNYVALLATGVARDGDGNANVTDCGDGTSVESGCAADVLPEFAYRGVAARLQGVELEGSMRLLTSPSVLDLELRGDVVRGDNLSQGEPLPRISPARFGSTLVWSREAWSARVGFDAFARQSRVPLGDVAVAGYTLWNAAVTYRLKAGPAQLLWFARLDNITDRLAFSATSILTQSSPGRVPLPGRSVRVGVRAEF